MSEQQPSEEEIRARLEEELRKITVRDVLLQTAVTLINLGGQRLGLGETSPEARDLDQTRIAIEAVRALLPLLEHEAPQEMAPLRDALAQLQMVYVREAGASAGQPQGGGDAGPGPGAGEPSGGQPPGGAGAPGSAPQRPGSSGRLWVPPGSKK